MVTRTEDRDVAVSLAAGAASLASVFSSLTPHLLAVRLIGLVLLTGDEVRAITVGPEPEETRPRAEVGR